jgi:antitoxin component YwqK of YwqJK toxin-antitoxin module
MNGYNDKGDRHGYWEDYWPNGKLWAKIHYINGEEVYYEVYFSDGNLYTKTFHL